MSREELTISWWWLLPIWLVAAVFGAYAVIGVWLDQDVWSLLENFQGAEIAGIAGATTGSMLTLTAAIWRAKTPQPTPDLSTTTDQPTATSQPTAPAQAEGV
ncbi:MAG TPA: hypothetical protein VFZ00_14850 [Solirubrobacter sp.]|nr:hypothetical protein [Solirubrobacter sp.]